MKPTKPIRTLFLVLLAFAFNACDEADAVSLRVHLRPDMSGTLTVSSLTLPTEAHPLAEGSGGVQWGDRIGLICASGEFAALTGIEIDGITFVTSVADGMNSLSVTLQQGPDVSWVKRLVPVDLGDERRRRRLSRTLVPGGQVTDLGGLFKFEIELPKAVVGNSVVQRARRMRVEKTKNVATLIVPLTLARSPGSGIKWHLTWES